MFFVKIYLVIKKQLLEQKVKIIEKKLQLIFCNNKKDFKLKSHNFCDFCDRRLGCWKKSQNFATTFKKYFHIKLLLNL